MLTLFCYEYDLRDEEKCNANIYRLLLLGTSYGNRLPLA